MSTASVRVENMCSTTGLILNGKQTENMLRPEKLNKVSFINGNYKYLLGTLNIG